MAASDSGRGALSGVRVLDAAEPMGAYVSRILGDLGADVIKIEPPGGDPGRRLAPFIASGAADQERLSLPFTHANLSKRSCVLDLEQREGQARFRALAAQADVVVSTEGVSAWAARGVDLGRLAAQFPALVWTSLTPFGLSGPYADYAGNNLIAEAMGGLMFIQGDDLKPPCVSPFAQAQHLASLHAVFGTLLALWERRHSGRGQMVEIAMQEIVAHIHLHLVHYTYNRELIRRPGVRNPITPKRLLSRVRMATFLSRSLCRISGIAWLRLLEVPELMDPAFRERDYRMAHID